LSVHRLCRTDDVPEGGGRGFRFGSGADLRAVFVVRQEGRLYGYVNSCPHQGTPLDFLPDHFFTSDGRHLLCRTHGAMFRVSDGVCFSGPCEGRRLERLSIRVEEGEILVSSP
jgi:nitrite reductase/ring-hydroxylating ferredoxin subunit